MFEITIPESDYYDEAQERFVTSKRQTLKLEHSLVSLSKWESKWKKPFLSDKPKTWEETIDYVRCMTITQNVNPDAYYAIDESGLKKIQEYINDSMTATWFRKDVGRPSRRIITSEVIYSQMITLGIPVDFEKWHLNRLMTLIRVCSEENAPKKKMGKKEILQQNRALNNARRKQHHTRG
jgi:hypothetical protein